MGNEDDDNIPTLHDILRPGDGAPARRTDETSDTEPETASERSDSPLTEAEIEAIAHRVIEKHTEHLRQAITQAIHEAIDTKNGERQSGGEDGDGYQG
ncbi:DUF2486 family protein [Halofilum ochraceum]|uniref:DUF2486 family protein n=1 Tax=Halofilum ochraceum TaxID=1611323 RepID=UPI00082BDB81|nr:DUF2486 family protein [Halofilum ochraceum]